MVPKERKVGQSCCCCSMPKISNNNKSNKLLLLLLLPWDCLLRLSCCRLSFKNCHTWRMRNMRNFLSKTQQLPPKRSSCCRCRRRRQSFSGGNIERLRPRPHSARGVSPSLAVSECGAISAQLTYIGATWQH